MATSKKATNEIKDNRIGSHTSETKGKEATGQLCSSSPRPLEVENTMERLPSVSCLEKEVLVVLVSTQIYSLARRAASQGKNIMNNMNNNSNKTKNKMNKDSASMNKNNKKNNMNFLVRGTTSGRPLETILLAFWQRATRVAPVPSSEEEDKKGRQEYVFAGLKLDGCAG